MLNIGLVASDAESAGWRAVAKRLRGANLEVGFDPTRADAALEACQAVLFTGTAPRDKLVIARVLKAGKHVLLATERCSSWDHADSLLETARQAGVLLASVNPDRYWPSRLLIKQQLPSKLGDVGLVRRHRWEPAGASTHDVADKLPSPLIRDLDLVLWLVGQSPQVVYALAQGDVAGSGGFVQVHLGFSAGMALLYDNRLPPGAGYQSLSVIGSTGAAYDDDQQNMQLVYRGGPPQGVTTDEGVRQRVAMTQEFVDALAQGRDLSTTVTAWREVFAVVDGVRESLATRQAVRLEGR